MGISGNVLVLCQKKSTSDSISMNLKRQGLEAFAVSSVTEAEQAMDKNPFDMVIVESNLGNVAGPEFLAEIRKAFPLTLRVLLMNSEGIKVSPDKLVNAAGVHQILKSGFNSQEIVRLLALEGAINHTGAAPSVDVSLENSKLKSLCHKMEEENKALEREISRNQKRIHDLERFLDNKANGGTTSADTAEEGESSNVDETELAEGVAMLTRAIDEILERDEVILPVLPQIGMEVQRMAADENCSFDELAKKVGIEQSLSARVLQVSNSAMYAGLKRIRNLHQAVARLGLRETRNVLQAVVAENLFKTKNKALMQSMAKLWMHSLCTAYCNENIAHMLEIPNSEDYFMMGLLHDIGKLLILLCIEELLSQGKWPREQLHEPMINGIMNASHHEAGSKLMQKWEYSAAFEKVVRLHNDDENIAQHDEPVIVTYFSNLMTRKLGYSLGPYRANLLENSEISRALNISAGTRYALEDNLAELIEQIKQSYFGVPQKTPGN
ncbi:MAG: HDOD domain-containing protein [Candidatus Sumerlaeia bacterium]